MERKMGLPSNPETEEGLAEKFQRYGARYEPSPDDPCFHAPISLEGFEETQSAERVLGAIKGALKDYAEGPIIHDSFDTDHDARTEWKKELPPELKKEYERNKLRINRIQGISSCFNLLDSLLEREEAHVSYRTEIQELHADLLEKIDDYPHRTGEERLSIAREVDQICRQFLRFITKTEKAP